jgi:DNA-binding NtrC family response regulator
VERSIIVSAPALQLKDLPPYLQAIPYSKKSMSFYNVAEEKNFTLPSIISLVEKKVIEDALHRAKGNKSEAMKSLGISRATFYSKLKQYFPEVLHKGPYLF